MAAVASYFSRFTMKFIEIVAASVATAVGGYLVAHLTGYLTSPAPTPAAVQVAPGGSGVVAKSPRARPTPPAAEAAEQRPAPAQEASPATPPARATANAGQAAPSRKPTPAEPEMESVEARVRAALEKVDAHRSAPAEAPLAKTDIGLEPPAAAARPRSAEPPVGASAVAAAPAAGEVSPPTAQQPPLQPEPLSPVEIKSRPVAAVEESLPPPAPAPAEEDKGILSTLEKIPAMLRPAAGATSNDPPRPPLPVGQ